MTFHQIHQSARLNVEHLRVEHLVEQLADINPVDQILKANQSERLNVKHLVEQLADINPVDQILKANQLIHDLILQQPLPKLSDLSVLLPDSFKDGLNCIISLVQVQELSYTSKWVSRLMEWRNSTDIVPLVVKKVATELALPLLTVSGLVETAVYKVLYLVAKALESLSSKPLAWIEEYHILERKESSFFTISWTMKMLYHNIVDNPLPVHEHEAKEFFIHDV